MIETQILCSISAGAKATSGAKSAAKGAGAGSTGNAGGDSVVPGLAGIAHPSDVLDMPVDPNEPTYCLCHQVSYGEMIGCDNPDVSNFTLTKLLMYCCVRFFLLLEFLFTVPCRMVPFSLCGTYNQAERKMVLPQVLS